MSFSEFMCEGYQELFIEGKQREETCTHLLSNIMIYVKFPIGNGSRGNYSSSPVILRAGLLIGCKHIGRTIIKSIILQTNLYVSRFETSHSRNNSLSQSLPIQRNLSSYENFDIHEQLTPEITIRHQNNYENIGRMDEIGKLTK